MCSNIKVTFTAPAFVQAGKSLTYTVEVTNNNKVAAKGLAIFLEFSKNVTDVSVKNVVSPDFDADTHTLKMNLDLFGPAQTSKGPNSKTITVTAKTVSGEGEDQTVTVEPGDEVTVDWTVDYQTQTVDSGSAVTTISKYPVVEKVTLAGLNLGYRYYANATRSDATTMTATLNSFVCTFDSLETQALSFDDALGADNGFLIGFPFSNSGSVQNCKTDRTWVCVGFVPYRGYGYTDMSVLKNYMFSKTGEDGFTLEDVLTNEGEEERMIERIALREAIGKLPEREQMVVNLRYFHGLTQERVARILGVSQVQISRLEKRALGRLRDFL